jgi:hypothetical protein
VGASVNEGESTGSRVFAVPNAGSLTAEVTEVEQACAAHDTVADNLELIDARRVLNKDAFDPNAEADFAYRKGAAGTCSVSLEDDTLEDLDPLFVAFNDLVVDTNCVTDAKLCETGSKLRGFDLRKNGRGVHGVLRRVFMHALVK